MSRKFKFKIASCFVQGKGHLQKGTPCQDFAFEKKVRKSNSAIIALADGAGSRSLSHLGAQCVTTSVHKIVSDNFDEFFKDNNLAKEKIYTYLINSLEKKTRELGIPLKELSSTLLFVVVKKTRKLTKYIAGHIGDGVIARLNNESLDILSFPENGEYSNTTYFVTLSNAFEHFRIYSGYGTKSIGFLLMSDGTAESLYSRKEKKLAPACKTIIEWLDNNKKRKVLLALKGNMEKLFREATFDDCSIAILKAIISKHRRDNEKCN